MLHGWPQHWYLWRDVIPAVAPHARVICPDLRGFGWTDVPRRGYEKDQLKRDVLAVLDELGVGEFTLAGHDWGGYVAFLLALEHPERVRGLLALNVLPPWPPRDRKVALDAWRFLYMPVLSTPGLGGWVGRTLGPRGIPEDARGAFASRLGGERARATERLYRTFFLRELPRPLRGRYSAADLRVPTRLVFGQRDVVITTRAVEDAAAQSDMHRARARRRRDPLRRGREARARGGSPAVHAPLAGSPVTRRLTREQRAHDQRGGSRCWQYSSRCWRWRRRRRRRLRSTSRSATRTRPGRVIPVQVPIFGCLKSNNNFPNLTTRELGLSLKDASCSGAETEDMDEPAGRVARTGRTRRSSTGSARRRTSSRSRSAATTSASRASRRTARATSPRGHALPGPLRARRPRRDQRAHPGDRAARGGRAPGHRRRARPRRASSS